MNKNYKHTQILNKKKALKSLRMMRNSRLEQGNIIDMFIRRCLLCFSKCQFSELVTLHEDFVAFKDSSHVTQKRKENAFTLDRKIEGL